MFFGNLSVLVKGMQLDKPISLYAATKKANELYAYTYHHFYRINMTGLRFFTVYGPWGRPDMALFKFTKNILEEKTIDVYNNGKMKRDFTYIDDIVQGVVSALDKEYSYEIAKGYVKLGHKVDVVTMGYRNLPKFEIKDRINIYLVKCLRSKKEICYPWEQLSES